MTTLLLLVSVLLASASFASAHSPLRPPQPASLRVALEPPSLSSTAAASPPPPFAFDLRDYGGVGDGVADDTAALQSALAAAVAAHGGTVFIPAGTWRITSTVSVAPSSPLSIRGEGWQSALLWEADTDLLVLAPPGGTQLAHSFFADFAVLCGGASAKSPASTALKFPTGLVRSTLSTLLFYGSGPLPSGGSAVTCGTNLDLGGASITDTVTVRDTLHWFLRGTGVVIGRGSEVRVLGGRIVGTGARNDSSIGVHVTGNNGGVHLGETDVIGLGTGLLLDNASGAGSNRETFITHATLDSNGVGLLINDNSYVSVAGMWAASCDSANVRLGAGAGGAHLAVAGGTIFNGGSLAPPGACGSTLGCHGLQVLAGDFSLSGVLLWANKGVGLLVAPPGGAAGFAVSGCRLEGNGQGASIANASTDFAVVGNVLRNNQRPSELCSACAGAVVASNVDADV